MTQASITTQDSRRKWLALAVVVAAQFMVVLDIAIVNVALPSIKTDLHFAQENLQWVISAYAILFGGALLLGGRLADIFGRRRLFMLGLALFSGGLAAVRPLLVGGVADRLPGAPGPRRRTARAGHALDPDDDVRRGRRAKPRTRDLGRGLRAAAARPASCSAASSRPTSAGRGSSSSTSRSGIAVIAAAPFVLAESRGQHGHRHFDVAGAASVTSGVMMLVYAMTRATQDGWGSTATPSCCSAARRR